MRSHSLPFIVCAVAAVLACGDDDSASEDATSSTTSTGGSSSTHTSASGGSSGPMGSSGAPVECGEVCSNLYGCGLQLDAMMMQLCPGFTGDETEVDRFLHGEDMMGGCIAACMEFFPAGIVDPMDCAGTVEIVKTFNADFASLCDNGFGDGGSSGSG